MRLRWEWVSNKSLGPIVIGAGIQFYVDSLGFMYDEKLSGDSDWDTYVLPDDDIYAEVSDGKVVSITAYREFTYEGRNLIGISVAQLERILGCSADEVGESVAYESGDVQTPYEYFDLGLQLWVRAVAG